MSMPTETPAGCTIPFFRRISNVWNGIFGAVEYRPSASAGVRAEKPLHILHVVLGFDFHGSERYCLEVMRHQAAQGHTVTLLAWAKKAGQSDAIQDHLPKGVDAYVCPPWRTHAAMRKAFRERSIDIVNAHMNRSAQEVLNQRRRPPAVMTMHLNCSAKKIRRFDGIICIAAWQEKSIAPIAKKYIVVENAPPPLPPVAPEDITHLRQSIGANKETRIVGYLGRLAPVKNVDILIKAFRKISPPNAILAIIGEGPSQAQLENLAQGAQSIRFVGYTSRAEAWHRAIDLFVLPSEWEGLSLSLLEAMSVGTAILASDCEGTAEALRGTTATLVAAGDEAALAAALDKILKTPGALERRQYDMRRFDIETIVSKTEAFYREILRKTK